jgi:excisionase family DNA binding protein
VKLEGYMTTAEAAAYLGVTNSRIRQLILDGFLPAIKLGDERRGMWLIRREDVEKLKKRPGPGRPRKGSQ